MVPGTMFRRRFVSWVGVVGIVALGSNTVSSQTYPNKPIRMLAAEAGGGGDFVARQVAQGLRDSLGQQVIVENQGGAGGLIAAQTVAKAPADGYSLLSYGSAIWLLPYLRDNVPYDPVRDFSPITLVDRIPNILVVHPSLPVKTVKDLIALAKARAGELNYGSAGSGTSTHLAAELFKTVANVNIVRISYRGNAAALNDLLGGQLQLMFSTTTAARPHVNSGRLRALAVTSANPSALFPSLPTVAASGLSGYESVATHGVFAPARTPATIINRLNHEIVQFLNKGDVKDRFFKAGIEIIGSSPEELSATMKSEMARLGAIIKNAGIRGE